MNAQLIFRRVVRTLALAALTLLVLAPGLANLPIPAAQAAPGRDVRTAVVWEGYNGDFVLTATGMHRVENGSDGSAQSSALADPPAVGAYPEGAGTSKLGMRSE